MESSCHDLKAQVGSSEKRHAQNTKPRNECSALLPTRTPLRPQWRATIVSSQLTWKPPVDTSPMSRAPCSGSAHPTATWLSLSARHTGFSRGKSHCPNGLRALRTSQDSKRFPAAAAMRTPSPHSASKATAAPVSAARVLAHVCNRQAWRLWRTSQRVSQWRPSSVVLRLQTMRGAGIRTAATTPAWAKVCTCLSSRCRVSMFRPTPIPKMPEHSARSATGDETANFLRTLDSP
mmetsp:Transcript_49363/g.130907  ORF Transcript_49363/g.130907 Transcript_49363/m.130907 type:complete len:234 (-) Transcript_49363:558-1259(-)